MDGSYIWNNKPNDKTFSHYSIDTMTEVIRTKPMFMVLEWLDVILYLETWITLNKSSIYKFIKVDICFVFELNGFLECRTLNYKIGWAMFNMPLAINTNIFLQFQSTSRYQRWQFTRLKDDYYMCIYFTLLGTIVRMVTCHNPSLGLMTKKRACKGEGQEWSPRVTFHAPKSVGKCEKMNPHTSKCTPTLGVVVSMDFQIFKERSQGSKLIGLKSYFYH